MIWVCLPVQLTYFAARYVCKICAYVLNQREQLKCHRIKKSTYSTFTSVVLNLTWVLLWTQGRELRNSSSWHLIMCVFLSWTLTARDLRMLGKMYAPGSLSSYPAVEKWAVNALTSDLFLFLLKHMYCTMWSFWCLVTCYSNISCTVCFNISVFLCLGCVPWVWCTIYYNPFPERFSKMQYNKESVVC